VSPIIYALTMTIAARYELHSGNDWIDSSYNAAKGEWIMMSGIGRSNDDATSIVKDDAEHSFSLLQSGSHHPKRGLGCPLVAWLRVD
jgi:hypothetical protein